MDSRRLLSLLHFSDSAFPTGGYAHSFGLEAYCQAGTVRDGDGLTGFLAATLEGSAGPLDATAAVAVLGAVKAGDVDGCRQVDETVEAMKPVREFREGSRQMGRQTLRVSALITGDARLQAYLGEVEAGLLPGHHGPAFGMAAGVLGATALEAATAFLYSTTALLVGAALRLLPMGQLEGQRVLWSLHPLIDGLARDAAGRGSADLSSFTPALDIHGVRHERFASRLFRS